MNSKRRTRYGFSWIASAVLALWESHTPIDAQAPPLPVHIAKPADARSVGLESLHTAITNDHGVPLPPNLGEFIRDKQAALRLGKALFWDMQVGSDAVQACASCHSEAGGDNRSRNLINPDILRVKNQRDGDINGFFDAPAAPDNIFRRVGPDQSIRRIDFPFVRVVEGQGAENVHDIAGSMGMFLTLFQGTNAGQQVDNGMRLNDPVFNVNGRTARRVEPRNTPTMINAVFNFTNFWDGRANNIFNGVSPGPALFGQNVNRELASPQRAPGRPRT